MEETSPKKHPAASLVTLSALLLLLIVPIPVRADQYGDFTYSTDGTNATITGYTGSNGVVMIPSTIAGLPITRIGDWAFYAASVTNVLIPDSATNIGDGAFFDCISLTNVTIGSGVTSIGDWAFGFCTSLASVCCRGNAPALGGDDVFYDDTNAFVYYLPGTRGWGATFGGFPTVLWNPPVPFTCTFNSDGVTLTITGYTGSGGAVVIPSTINFLPVTSIGNNAFFNYYTNGFYNKLISVTIPDSVTNIGDFAFFYSENLISVTFGTGLINIGEAAFYSCDSLTNVTIPDSVANIGDEAFFDCTSLTNVTIPNSVTNLGYDAFESCYNLVNATIGSNVTYIGDQAFAICESLTSITIPNGVKSIGDEAFYSCYNLVNVTMGCNVTYIGEEAFYECIDLTSVTIPSSVTNIGSGPFADCTNLTTITVDAQNLFYGSMDGVLFDKSQKKLLEYPGGLIGGYTIPNSVTNIAAEAFADCLNLTTVTIPASVISIGNSAFYGCIGLTNVTIGTNLTSIGANAFEWCNRLTDITIPSSVTNIGAYAFMGCIGLTNVYFMGNAPNIDFAAFQLMMRTYSLDPATVYYLPGTSGWIPQVDTSGAGFGVQSNQFGFTVTGNSSLGVVVEACTNLAHPVWAPVAINIPAGSYFGDPLWTNYSPRFPPGLRYLARFYRLRASTFAGLPMVLWNPQVQMSNGSFGVHNNRFGFTITGTTNIPIVLEASTNLAGAPWTVLQSCNLTNGSVYFGDPAWTNYPSRFYRIRPP